MTLVAFDFDGTLSDSEMTVLLGERRGVEDAMEEITARAMNDEIDYAQSLRERAALLEGLPVEEAERAWASVSLRPGAAHILADLRAAGVETAILTGGFERGVEAALAAADVAVDRIVANRLPVAGGELTGDVSGPLIEGTKDEALASLASDLAIPLSETVAVGDGANDLPMLEAADLAVGFDPKPAVEPHCETVVSSMDALGTLLRERDLLA